MSVMRSSTLFTTIINQKTITGKSFQHFIHEQNLPPQLKVDNFCMKLKHTQACLQVGVTKWMQLLIIHVAKN